MIIAEVCSRSFYNIRALYGRTPHSLGEATKIFHSRIDPITEHVARQRVAKQNLVKTEAFSASIGLFDENMDLTLLDVIIFADSSTTSTALLQILEIKKSLKKINHVLAGHVSLNQPKNNVMKVVALPITSCSQEI
eukprot:snap_masked-scaffold_9-processed-gene-2.46-mRNA-1 protein AED:1.00 eAED:1.00 QI:0/-1/0/0/-1/1/1/0/135